MMTNNDFEHSEEKSAVDHDMFDSNDVTDGREHESDETRKTSETERSLERPGIILKRERERQGLSLEIVHEATKIPLDALRAIEEGYKIRSLSSFYYGGFLRMYAKYLNIATPEVVEDVKQEEDSSSAGEAEMEFKVPKWVEEDFWREQKPKIIIALVAILAVFFAVKAIGFIGSLKSKRTVKKEKVKVESVHKEVKAEVKVAVKKAADVPPPVVQQKAPKIALPTPTPKVVPPHVPELMAVPEPVVKPKANTVPAVVLPQKEVNLTVRANRNSWLRVKVDGIIVFQSTLRIGDVETWLADDQIEISGRNINQLEFELNGKLIGRLGRRDHNAKKVIITKSGLSVN